MTASEAMRRNDHTQQLSSAVFPSGHVLHNLKFQTGKRSIDKKKKDFMFDFTAKKSIRKTAIETDFAS